MNRIELTRVSPVTRPARILQTVQITSGEVSLEHSNMVCSPRASIAYSFLVSWQWLKTKLRCSLATKDSRSLARPRQSSSLPD